MFTLQELLWSCCLFTAIKFLKQGLSLWSACHTSIRLEFDFQKQCRKEDWWPVFITPMLWKWKQRNHSASLASQPTLFGEHQDNKSLGQKQDGQLLGETYDTDGYIEHWNEIGFYLSWTPHFFPYLVQWVWLKASRVSGRPLKITWTCQAMRMALIQ